MQHLSHHRGFTLIELLVVIAIISILASVVLTSLDSTRAAGRDAVRKAELKEIQSAMELYYSTYETYQVSGAGYNNGGNGWFGREDSSNYQTAISRVLYEEGFLPRPLYEDPIQEPGYMIYICDGGERYSISATLENPDDGEIQQAYRLCNGGISDSSCSDVPGAQSSGNGNGCRSTVGRYGKNYAVGF